ncbi:unnamed protein product [Lathyrus sativus]|nr:unnamed protein product [Lathyrus sativus]
MTAGSQDDGQSEAASSSLSLTASQLPFDLSSLSLTAPHLPFDLVAEILCRLPVKQLLQLCCVCKLWNSLISFDSKFARKQLSLSASHRDSHHLFLSSTRCSCEFLLCHSPISSFFTSASNIVPVKQFSPTLTGVLNNGRRRAAISACDGLLCFGIDKSLAVLYNPSTRKSKILPPLENSKETCFLNSYTLVYDRVTSNYKIVAIVTLCDSKIEVNIHVLGTDYWTRIPDFPCSSLIRKPGIFVNDTVNWFASENNLAWVIVSLDLEKESYQKFSPPFYKDGDSGTEHSIALGAFKGCLSILSHICKEKISNIWIMKEYGNEKSWTKLFSIPHSEEGMFYCYVKVLYISEDDKLLMEFYNMGEYGFVVYDSINNTFSIPKMQNNIHDHKVVPQFYVQSLISPL